MPWRIKQHYGFGAARITLRPLTHTLPHHAAGGPQDLHEIWAELRGRKDGVRQLASMGILATLLSLLVAGLAVILALPASDRSDIRLVMLQSAELQPLEPEIPAPRIEPASAPVPIPKKTEPKVAKVKPPEVAPASKPKPKPPAATRVAKKPPPPPVKPKRSRPKVKIDGLAAMPVEKPTPAIPRNRVELEPSRARQRVAVTPLAQPKNTSPSQTKRSLREARVTPTADRKRVNRVATVAGTKSISSWQAPRRTPIVPGAARNPRFRSTTRIRRRHRLPERLLRVGLRLAPRPCHAQRDPPPRSRD